MCLACDLDVVTPQQCHEGIYRDFRKDQIPRVKLGVEVDVGTGSDVETGE